MHDFHCPWLILIVGPTYLAAIIKCNPFTDLWKYRGLAPVGVSHLQGNSEPGGVERREQGSGYSRLWWGLEEGEREGFFLSS